MRKLSTIRLWITKLFTHIRNRLLRILRTAFTHIKNRYALYIQVVQVIKQVAINNCYVNNKKKGVASL